jgi:hypothetical protein
MAGNGEDRGGDCRRRFDFGGKLPYRLQKDISTFTRINPLRRPAMDEILATGEIQAFSAEEKLDSQQGERLALYRQRSIQPGQ